MIEQSSDSLAFVKPHEPGAGGQQCNPRVTESIEHVDLRPGRCPDRADGDEGVCGAAAHGSHKREMP